MFLRNLLLIGGLAMALGGCKSNPYCLNCGKTSGAGGLDGGGVDLSGLDLTTAVVDMTGFNGDGGCVPTNNGVEICDGLDNDCNGLTDDVSAAKLSNDPNNCGACGMACNYAATHQFGACMNAMCMPSGCTPGFVDADGNAANGCEYQCTPTVPPTEVCDGVDNNCNGVIDEGFTTTWKSNGTPNYDSDVANCGGCGFACNLPGAVNKCAAGSSGAGTCQVDHCLNNPGVDTFRHDPSVGDINSTGCEYHCPFASSTAGDCDASGGGGCTFPVEVCNGQDDNCNFLVDDNVTDPDLMAPALCGSKCPGGLVANCRGQCTAGTLVCSNGVKLCSGGSGPGPEVCDGIDNNCDGQVDEPFTSPAPGGYMGGDTTKPLYNSDANNCGGCTKATNPNMYNGVCALANAANGCHSASAGARGNCYVVSCNSGFNYVSNTDSNKAAPTCNVPTVGTKDSVAGNVASGVGCFYSCASGFSPPLATCSNCIPSATEVVCDGKDNNCDGCIDNIPIANRPSGICSTLGVCHGATIPVACQGATGWGCDYSGVSGIDLTAGKLSAIETKCDGEDNNCNGYCDENFPTVATDPSSTKCSKNSGRAAAACTSGQGVCQAAGKFCCGAVAGTCADNPAGPFGTVAAGVVCNVAANLGAATDEVCDGIDNNCNGAIDDFAPANGKKGYHDPVATVTVLAGDPSMLGNPAAHTVYVYEYEAGRPDSTSLSPGGQSARACSKQGVIPWSGATEDQARQACNSAGGRLCTAFEWQAACEGPSPSPSPMWSKTVNPTTYVQNVCNTGDRSGGPAVWTTGNPGSVGGDVCSTMWPDVPQPSPIADLSGNLFEWTWTPVLLQTLTGSATASVSSTGIAGQMQIHFAPVPGTGGFLDNNTTPGFFIQLSNANTGTTNGQFVVLTVVDNQTAVVANPSFPANGGTDTHNNTITWALINTYYKVRGGSFTSPKNGATCEFDFDIATPGFSNTDVGFRCCFDKKPCSVAADCPASGACTNGLCP